MTSPLRTGQETVQSTFIMEKVRSIFTMGPSRIDRSLKPPSCTLRGLDSIFQTAQSAIIGLPVNYRTYCRDISDSFSHIGTGVDKRGTQVATIIHCSWSCIDFRMCDERGLTVPLVDRRTPITDLPSEPRPVHLKTSPRLLSPHRQLQTTTNQIHRVHRHPHVRNTSRKCDGPMVRT